MRKKHSDTIRRQVKKVYSVIADEFDKSRRAPWQEFEHFLDYVSSGDKVLDLGCGNGRLFDFLKGKNIHYTGIDQSAELLEKARKQHPHATFQEGDMVDIKAGDQQFDALFCIAAFHHVPSRKLRAKAVKEMHRVLKKDGIVILTVWNLFQWKYTRNWLEALFSFLICLGQKYAWNDLWIEWSKNPIKRYYHAFLPGELRRYFKKGKWEVKDFYFVRSGYQVKFWRSFNQILIVRKK